MSDEAKTPLVSKQTGVTIGLALTCMILFGTWTRFDATWKADIDNRISNIETYTGADVDSLNTRVTSLEGRVVGNSPNSWHRQQMSVYSRELELMNSAIGLVVPPMEDIPHP